MSELDEYLALRKLIHRDILHDKAATELTELRAALDKAREIIKCHYTKDAAAWLEEYKEII